MLPVALRRPATLRAVPLLVDFANIELISSAISMGASDSLESEDFSLNVRTRVKICGITRPEDADAAEQAGADAIGLVFYAPSPRNVTVEQAARIARRVPAFVTVVGVFVDPSADFLAGVLERVPLDLLQFHGREPPRDCASAGRPYMKALRVGPEVDLAAEAARYPHSRAILVDSYVPGVVGGTGQIFPWERVRAVRDRPIVLAGGLALDNVAKAIRAVRPFGVDASSSVESSKGIKDADAIRELVRIVRAADATLQT